MNLNSTIIAEDLGSLCRTSRILTDCETLPLNRFEIADEHSSAPYYESSVLLIAEHQSHLVAPPSNCAILMYGQSVTDEAFELFPEHDIIVAKPDASLVEIVSALSRIFARYSDWLSQLDDILHRNGSVDDMVEASMPIFQSNIMIHDDSFRVISYHLYGTDQKANQFAKLGKGGFFAQEQIRLLKQSFRLNANMAKPFRVKGPHANRWIDGRTDLSTNVFLPGGYTVRINMSRGDGESSVPAKLSPLIQQFGNYIRYAYLMYPPNIVNDRNSKLTESMTRLYDGEHVPREELKDAADEIGWDFHDDLIMASLVIPLDEDNLRADLTKQPLISISNRLMSISPEIMTLYPNNTLCLLLNYTRSNLTMREVKRRLDKVAKENQLLIAYAMPNEGLRHTKFGYDQIKSLVKYALEKQNEPGAYFVEDLALDFAYQCVKREIKPFALVPFGLVMLLTHDNAKSSELYPTLRAYVECDCSPAKAAKRLFIERSTFYYRLNQALDILDMDLEDPEVKLKLLLAFRILDEESERTLSMM